MQIKLSREVASALANRLPVVALESTVISHGLPHPHNLETAVAVEAIVREGGAVPATIAIFDGEFCVGLDRGQIERLANDTSFIKASRRDLAIIGARSLNAATTVATTAFAAHIAGINIFATGGIGGVHRGGAWDVSADLPELARTPIVVVCAGAKIVLDLSATREWLETHGVTVLGWQCDEMPAFYSRHSGLAVDARVETADDVAAIARERDDLGALSAILVAAPVPRENEIERESVEQWVESSVSDAARQGIAGKALTPFLLSQLTRMSDGLTLAANIALLKNNATIAAQIASALAGN